MNKLLVFVFSAAISMVGIATTQAMPITRFESIQPGLTTLVSSGCPNSDHDCTTHAGAYRAYSVARHHRNYRVARQDPYYPYMPSQFNISGYDAGQHNFCAFGSYIACGYAGAYCWQRCY